MLRAAQLFDAAGIAMQGPVPWETPISESGPGVYVLTFAASARNIIGRLNDDQRTRWIADQEIVYIGRSKHLRRRLRQLYRHEYGQKRPHRGGQDVLLLEAELLVYWGAAPNYADAEDRMIEEFRDHTKFIPFANRVRAAQASRGSELSG